MCIGAYNVAYKAMYMALYMVLRATVRARPLGRGNGDNTLRRLHLASIRAWFACGNRNLALGGRNLAFWLRNLAFSGRNLALLNRNLAGVFKGRKDLRQVCEVTDPFPYALRVRRRAHTRAGMNNGAHESSGKISRETS
jgi:hypothetical protein